MAESEITATAAARDPGDHFLGLKDMQDLFGDIRSDLLRLLRRRTGNVHLADDLAQDLYLKLPTIRAPIADRQQGRAYLCRMASNLAIDYVRIEARRAEILDGAQVLFEDVQPNPEDFALSRDQLRRVEAVLDELPEKCRAVIVLARMHGLGHKAIAAQLGVSVSLVEKYQLRAFRHLRERLGSTV